jgi:hypothetical protein
MVHFGAARKMFTPAPEPKKFIALSVSNHCFTDKVPKAISQIAASLRWLENPTACQIP